MSGRTSFYMKEMTFLSEPYHYIECGLEDIFLLNGVSETETDYGTMIRIENINELHRAIGLRIIGNGQRMTGAEFRFLQKQTGHNQIDLADISWSIRSDDCQLKRAQDD